MSIVVGTGADGTPELQPLGRVCLADWPGPGRPSIVTCGAGEAWGSRAGPGGTCIATTLCVRRERHLRPGAASSVGLRRYFIFADTSHGFRSRVCLAVPLAGRCYETGSRHAEREGPEWDQGQWGRERSQRAEVALGGGPLRTEGLQGVADGAVAERRAAVGSSALRVAAGGSVAKA